MNRERNSIKLRILYVGNKLTRHGFTPGVIDTLGPILEKEGYMVSYVGTRRNQLLRLFEMFWGTVTIGRKVDYILIDTYSTSAFWYAYLTGRLAKNIGTKYVPILHGGDLPARLARSKRICDRLFKSAHANVAVSGYLRFEFEKAGYGTLVIPNSISIYLYPFKKRDNPRPKLLWVRSFRQHYNPKMAVDVVSELIKYYGDVELCMVGPDGDGSLDEFNVYARERNVENHIKITGKLARDEWIKMAAGYDFFINTTNIDNTPVSVIEALALGLAVISTDPGGIPFLLTDNLNSCLVSCGNATQMAEKIDSLIKQPFLYHQITTNGRELAESFDWLEIKHKWIDLLK